MFISFKPGRKLKNTATQKLKHIASLRNLNYLSIANVRIFIDFCSLKKEKTL